MKILIAEDEPDLLNQYKVILEEANHQVTISEDGDIAISLYSEAFDKLSPEDVATQMPFDAVILDYQMPNKNGLDVAKEILDFNPKQRILIVTAHVKTMLEGIRKLGSKIEVLSKPFPSLAMIRQVEGLARFRWQQKLAKGMKEWDGETGLSEPI